MNLYCVWSKVASKTLAKGAASLKCIKLLHESGELNDWLVTNGSKASEKAEKLELVAASKGIISYHINEDDAHQYIHSLVHITQFPAASKVTVESPEAELVSVIVKTVADTMAQPPEILAVRAAYKTIVRAIHVYIPSFVSHFEGSP